MIKPTALVLVKKKPHKIIFYSCFLSDPHHCNKQTKKIFNRKF